MFQCKVQTSGKEGYLSIKQPIKARGIGFKPWKKRWVVFHPMNDLATKTFIVRLDIFTDEDANRKNADKVTQYLENVTWIKRSRSKSQTYAFEIGSESGVLIYLAGESETDCQEWMNIFRNTVWPPLININKDGYDVGVIDNTDSGKIQLSGSFLMDVSYDSISLYNRNNGNLEKCWHLRSLKCFGMAPSCLSCDQGKIFSIAPGPYSKTGEGNLLFFSYEADKLLEKIRHTIQSHLSESSPHQTIGNLNNLLQSQLSLIDQIQREPSGTSTRAMSDSHLSNVQLNPDFLYGPNVSRIESIDSNLQCETKLEHESLKPIFNTEKRPSITYSRSDNDLQLHLQKDMDPDGYSQIKENSSFLYPEIVKERTSSTCSEDSGVLTMSNRESRSCSDESNDFSPHTLIEESINENKTADSFGIDIMALSATELTSMARQMESSLIKNTIKNEILNQIIISDRERKESHTYQDVEELQQQIIIKETIKRISDSENPYEELDKFRKDISRFLGIPLTAGQDLDNEVTKTNPPQLPKRPSSLCSEKSPTLKRKIVKHLSKCVKERDSKSLTHCSDEDQLPTIKSCQFWPIRPKSTSGGQVAKNDLYNSKEECSNSDSLIPIRKISTSSQISKNDFSDSKEISFNSNSLTPSRKISAGSMISLPNADMQKLTLVSCIDLLTGDCCEDNLPPPPVTPIPTKLATLSFSSQFSSTSLKTPSLNMRNDPWSPNQASSSLDFSFESSSSVFSSPTEIFPNHNELWEEFAQFEKPNITKWASFDQEKDDLSSLKNHWEQFPEYVEMPDNKMSNAINHSIDNQNDYLDMTRTRHSIRSNSDLSD